ncbi:hypothetical protein QZH41_002596 [Actinostola sp. cb2023]|nr:hypothetical protein QZH41_002596 [Actinostola sp. cb2023]
MKTTTNLLLLNVAVADIITLLLTAIHVIFSKTVIYNNSFLCKVISPNTLSNVALLATIITLTVIAIERYNALVKPMRVSRRLTTNNVLFVIVGIWIVSLVMALPMLIYLDYDPVKKSCSPGKNINNLLVSIGGIVLAMTIIPFLIIAFCYSQIISGLYFRNTICTNSAANPGLNREELITKRKLVKLLVTITIVFFIAFVPYGVLQISRFSVSGRITQTIINLINIIWYLMPLHSCINPFLYTLQSRNYREGFKVVAKKMICSKSQGWNIDGQISGHRTPAAVSFRRDQVTL